MGAGAGLGGQFLNWNLRLPLPDSLMVPSGSLCCPHRFQQDKGKLRFVFRLQRKVHWDRGPGTPGRVPWCLASEGKRGAVCLQVQSPAQYWGVGSWGGLFVVNSEANVNPAMSRKHLPCACSTPI